MRGNRDHIECAETSIGTESSNLILLPNLDIPHPDDLLFGEFAIRYVRGDLSLRGDGFPTAVWKWAALERWMVDVLVNMGGGWDAGSGGVYIRTRTNQAGQYRWRNFSCSMYLPRLSGDDGKPSLQMVDAFEDVTILFAGLTLI